MKHRNGESNMEQHRKSQIMPFLKHTTLETLMVTTSQVQFVTKENVGRVTLSHLCRLLKPDLN